MEPCLELSGAEFQQSLCATATNFHVNKAAKRSRKQQRRQSDTVEQRNKAEEMRTGRKRFYTMTATTGYNSLARYGSGSHLSMVRR